MDLYCPDKRLAIEIIGSIHNLPNSQKCDKYREGYLQAFNIKIQKIFKYGSVYPHRKRNKRN